MESDRPASQPSTPPHVPPGGMATAAHAHDWSKSPLGPPESWPPALKIAAGIAFRSNLPMMVGWGRNLLLVHNDSYGETLLGDRQPALGKPMREVWADNWEAIGPYTERALGGETVHAEASPRILRRGGK